MKTFKDVYLVLVQVLFAHFENNVQVPSTVIPEEMLVIKRLVRPCTPELKQPVAVYSLEL